MAVQAVVDAYAAAYEANSDPGTKTAATVATKDGAKAAMLSVIRSYAKMISANQAVLDADKVTIGVTVYDFTKTPVPAPGPSRWCRSRWPGRSRTPCV